MSPTIQSVVTNFLNFLNETVVPFIFVIAFLVFLWGAFKYFILESDSEEGRKNAKALALWGILGFVIMVSLWGIVNLFADGLGLNKTDVFCPDYMATKNADDCVTGGENSGS